MQREFVSIGKSLLVSIIITTFFYFFIRSQMSRELVGQQLVNTLRAIFDWPLEAIALVATLIGLQGLFQRLHDYVLGPALVETSALTLAALLTVGGSIPRGGQPLIDRLWPPAPGILDPRLELPNVHLSDPRAANRPFLRRDDEIRALMTFAGEASGKGPTWTRLEGREGIGKTRTALEWLKRLREWGWDVGKLRQDIGPQEIRRTRFRRKTAIFIDDVRRLGDSFWPTLLALLEVKRRLRILVEDQLVPQIPADLSAADRELLKTACRTSLRLQRLSRETLRALASNLPETTINDADGRPLYVLLGKSPADTIRGRAERRMALAANDAERKTLALAALAGPLPKDVAHRVPGISGHKRRLRQLFEGEDREDLATMLPALHPEPFADEILLRWLEDHDVPSRRDLFDTGLSANSEAVESRLGSLWQRTWLTAEQSQIRETMQARFDELMPQRVAAIRGDAGDLLDKTGHWDLRNQLHALGSTLERLSAIARIRPFDREIRLHEAQSAVNATHHYGSARQFADLERWGKALLAVARDPRFEADPEIRCREAKGAVNAIRDYGAACQFADLERWAEILLGVTRDPRFEAEPVMRLCEAQGALNAVHGYGPARQFADLERWGKVLLAVADDPRFEADPEIRRCEAMGAINAIRDYGAACQFADLERWGEVLLAATRDPGFEAAREMRRCEAQGAVNAIYRYGAACQFADLERWGEVLLAVTRDPRFAADTEIRLCEAQGAVNATHGYGPARQVADLERWAKILLGVTRDPRFAADGKIRLREAQGAFNAIDHYGTERQFADLERWGEVLLAVTRDPRFATDSEIRLCEAQGAVNAIFYYGEACQFADLERWGEVLLAVTRDPRLAADSEIRLREAQGAVNAIIGYDAAGNADGSERWRRFLASVARDDLRDQVQELAGRFGVTYVEQRARGWPYGSPTTR